MADVSNNPKKIPQKHIELLFEAMPLACHIWNKDFEIIESNEENVRLFSAGDKGSFHERFDDCSPEFQPDGQRSYEKSRKQVEKAFTEGKCVFEWMHQTLDGALIPTEVSLIRVPYEDEYVVASYVRDLREYKEVMDEVWEANEHMRLMLDSNPLMCIMKDEKGNTIDCNQEALNILGVTSKLEFCHHFNDYFPEYQPDGTQSADRVAEIIRSLSEKDYCITELTFRSSTGELIPTSTKVVRIPRKNINCYLSYSFDLREAKVNEQKLREITEKEHELRIQNEVALAANEAKSQFIAHMSHEIRTPMNSIVGFSELALDSKISPKTREYLTRIKDNSNWLLQIINDILDFSKIESRNMDLDVIPFDLNELIKACKFTVSPKAVEKNINLYFHTESSVEKRLLGDSTKLKQVLINLLSNAIKFTEKGEVILSVIIENSTEENVTLRFEVKDSGIGISPEQIKKIFDPFVQADVSTTRKYGGTGLGMTITKRILDLMNSKLEIDSTLGAGTTVRFSLTFDTIDISDESTETSVTMELEKPIFEGTVLVFEDNRMNQWVIIEHLERIGFTVEIANNGQEGIDKIKSRADKGEKPYDLVFMDIHMPVMDGIEATPKIIEMKTGSPIVAMTANIIAKDRALYKAIGMDDYVGKPFTSQDLWHCLLKYLKPIGFTKAGGNEKEGDDDLQKQLKADFVKDNQNRFNEIIAAIDAGDITLAHRMVHNLKSNSGLIGRSDLHKIASNVEASLRDGENLTTEGQLDALRFELHAALGEMASYKESTAAKQRETETTDELGTEKARELIERLEPLLASGNPECLDLVDALRSIPGSEELIQQIEDFYFSAASELLKKLKERMEYDQWTIQ